MKRRLLYCIPIVHSEADLGSLAADAKRAGVNGDEQAWRKKQALIAQFWANVAAWCSRLPKDLTGYRIYQDGLPVCGQEHRIVDELAAKGSQNHLLVRSLLERGATLEGTESGPLLVQEYRLAQVALGARGARADGGGSRENSEGGGDGGSSSSAAVMSPAQVAAESAALLKQRDAFIANRIDETLRPGETGVLFIGYLHDVLTKLPRMIDVQTVSRLA